MSGLQGTIQVSVLLIYIGFVFINYNYQTQFWAFRDYLAPVIIFHFLLCSLLIIMAGAA